MNEKRQYRLAALLVVLCGVMHLVVLGLGQFTGDIMELVAPAGLYLMLGVLLYRGRRWAAWVAFLCMLVGITVALLRYYSSGQVAGWMFQAITGLHVLAALVLFAILWKSKEVFDSAVEAMGRD